MNYRLALLPLLGALLSACANSPSKTTPANPPSTNKQAHPQVQPIVTGRCSSTAVDHLVNRVGSRELLEQARQQAGAQRARLIGEDDMVTMDYDNQRLNMYLDAEGRVKLLSCG